MSKSKTSELSAKKPKDYLQHALNSDFWQYIYTNAHLYSSEDDSAYIGFMKLRDVFDEMVVDRYEQRTILNAHYQKMQTGKSAFELNALSKEVFDLSFAVSAACSEYGYCPSDLAEYIHPESIIHYMLENGGAIPLPPYPLPSNPEQRLRLLTRYLPASLAYDGDLESVKSFIASHPMDPPQNPLAERYNARQDDIQIHLNKLNRIILFSMVQGGPVPEALKQEYTKLKKDLSDAKYRVSGNLARAIGLLLWNDAESKHNGNSESAVKEFRESQIYSEINEKLEFQGTSAKYLSDKENSILYRWVEKTAMCVAKRKVLSFK